MKLGGRSPMAHFSEHHKSVARAQHEALRRYRPRAYPGRLTLFRARMQPFFSSHDPLKGWTDLAGGGIDVAIVPGNHVGILQEPHVRVLAEEIRARLDGHDRAAGAGERGGPAARGRAWAT
jgi:thioesterase domain-containing protein